ncbi:hypothetical protein [Microbacterium sp. CIAB417]|uniref:hypothetical protein n=1 Tax=Microbacterium sp. CIAB417 TaxID=2860287 RepID=UPI001FABB518|nr:hypothetical protein [Microbacterium sp. CIAB417]
MRRTRLLRRILIGAGAASAVVALAVLVPLSTAQAPVCASEPATFPAAGVEGWEGEQLENAATIVLTARGLGFGRDGQVVGVMAAMGESSLRAIEYGDWETAGVTNPDGSRTTSIGLFQQQEWWGSAEERLDPASSAALFFDRLARLPGWEDMEPSHAIHRVQVNTDPEHYARFQEDAEAVVDALSGACTPTD